MNEKPYWPCAHRIPVGLGILIAFLMFLGFYTANKASIINQRVNNILTQELMPLESIEGIKASMYRIRERVGRHITEPRRQNFHEKKIAEQLTRLARNLDRYKQTRIDAEESLLLSTSLDAWKTYITIIESNVLPLSREGKYEAAEDILYHSALQSFRAARQSLNALSDYQINRAERRQNNADMAYISILKITLAVIIFSLFLGVASIIRHKQNYLKKKLGELILSRNSQGVMTTDKQLNITWVNQAFEKMTGYSSDEVIGKTPAIFSSDKQTPEFYQNMWICIHREGVWEGEIWYKRKDGSIYPQWLNIVAMEDQAGNVYRYVSTFIDLSPLKKAEDKIKQLAYYDQLTGLGNTHLLEKRLDVLISNAKTNDGQVGLLLIDLDRFKEINANLGRKVGDILLKNIAHILLENRPEKALIIRHDSDRFIVVLSFNYSSFKKGRQALETFSKHINKIIASPIHCNSHEVHINCSIGIASLPKDATDSETLLKYASMALSYTKKSPRSSFQFYDSTLAEDYNYRYQLGLGINKAIECKELFLMFQPQVDRQGDIVGAEVLLRWKSHEFGLVPPDIFIPLAEKNGDIMEIGRWVFSHTLTQIKQWEKSGLCGAKCSLKRLAINVSPHQILSENTYNELYELCHSADVSPAAIELEITETSMMSFSDHIIARLEKIRDHGFGIAIDDFGTGYSSLGRLNHFPVSILKIDRSFTQQILSDSAQAAIVQYIINMAHTLNVQVVAEGVEEQAEVIMLMEYGCDLFQGYYFSRPMSADDFETYVTEKSSIYLIDNLFSTSL